MLGYRLRHRLIVQRPVEAQDQTTGSVVTTWETVTLPDGTVLSSVPAEVLTGPGREVKAQQADIPEGSARINMRWFPGLDAKWRLLWDGDFDSSNEWTGVIFDITSIETDLTGRFEYRLLCESGLRTAN